MKPLTEIKEVVIIGGSRAWMDKDAQALTAWFREFVNWMQTSPNGKCGTTWRP